jgi:hypothetical protein
MKLVIKLVHKTHLVRAAGWVALVPVAILMGWHESVFLVFLMSAYANIMTDVGAWEAKQAQESDDG